MDDIFPVEYYAWKQSFYLEQDWKLAEQHIFHIVMLNKQSTL